jgi:hypothetical protein
MLVIVMAGAAALMAETDEELSTDRPGFTESADTVPPGAIQLEGGLLISRHALASGPSQQIGGPFPLVRIGIARFAELRWSTDGMTSQSQFVAGEEQHHVGGSDLEVGVKARFWNEHKYSPAFAVIAALSVPTGGSYFTSGSPDPFLELFWNKSLPGSFDVGGNVNFRWETAEAHTEQAQSLSIGRKLGAGFRMYGEIYRISPIQDDEREHWIVNSGVTKLLGGRAQIDLEIGHTVKAYTPYWFVGAGFAVRVSGRPILHTLTRWARG